MAPLTAVDWLLENIPQRFANALKNECEDIILGAKQMEKEQIIKTWEDRVSKLPEPKGYMIDFTSAEEYYNDTYNK